MSAASTSALDREITITTFDGYAATSKAEVTTSLRAFIPQLRDTTANSKAELPWAKLATFGEARTDNGSFRHDKNIVSVDGAELDYDGEKISPEDAETLMRAFDIECVISTSPSHTDAKPRWRIWLPFSKSLPPCERARMVARANGIFGGVLAGESFTLSQAFYYGRVGSNPAHRVIAVDGRSIDEATELPEVGKRGKAPVITTGDDIAPMPGGRTDVDALLADVLSGAVYHEPLRNLAAHHAAMGMSRTDIIAFLRALMEQRPEADRDDRWRKRYASIDRLASSAVAKYRPGADDTSTAPDAKPTIRVRQGELPALVDQAERALLKANLGLYQRGGAVVQIAETTEQAPDGSTRCVLRLHAVNDKRLTELLAGTARWERKLVRENKVVPTDPPTVIAQTYLARGGIGWHLPMLNGIIRTPTLRRDGSLLDQSGYDAATGLYLHLGDTIPPCIAAKPTQRDAADALNVLLDLIAEFPFADAASKAVAVSMMLTAIVRPALPAAPAHAATATTYGSGKSYLTDTTAVIATGDTVAPIACGSTDEEFEKRLAAELMAGKALIVIDNINRQVNGPLLAQIITQPKVNPRRLGKSENVEIPNTAFLILNGNNIAISADMARRVVLCSLDAKVERPELRTFYQNPMAMVRQDRGRYVGAVLTILRAYLVAGMPAKPAPIGSFELWSDWVRGALLWLGCADPAASMETVRDADPEQQALVAVMAQWDSALGCSRVTSKQIIAAAARPGAVDGGEFREALLAVAGARGVIDSNRLGAWLRENKGRIAGGGVVSSPGKSGRAP